MLWVGDNLSSNKWEGSSLDLLTLNETAPEQVRGCVLVCDMGLCTWVGVPWCVGQLSPCVSYLCGCGCWLTNLPVHCTALCCYVASTKLCGRNACLCKGVQAVLLP
jgi:hypothetical protein